MPAGRDAASREAFRALEQRITGIVDSMNEVGRNARKYVDECDEKQTKNLENMEERLTELIETKVKNYDKLVRKVVVEEFAKIGK